MMPPRYTPRRTRAEGQFAEGFWGAYVNAYYFGGNEEPIGNANAVFSPGACAALENRLGPETLAVPVLFSDRLSNRSLANNIAFKNGSQCIVINARFRTDPEILAHSLVEEFAHAWQRLNNVDFDAQSSQFAYADRPYEIEAKRIATEILGYEPGDYDTYIQREEPEGVLYDRPR